MRKMAHQHTMYKKRAERTVRIFYIQHTTHRHFDSQLHTCVSSSCMKWGAQQQQHESLLSYWNDESCSERIELTTKQENGTGKTREWDGTNEFESKAKETHINLIFGVCATIATIAKMRIRKQLYQLNLLFYLLNPIVATQIAHCSQIRLQNVHCTAASASATANSSNSNKRKTIERFLHFEV